MNIHIIGIKGWGTSALAQILKARGNRICGSDTLDAVPSDAVLKQAGISVEPFGADAVSADLDRVIIPPRTVMIIPNAFAALNAAFSRSATPKP